MKSALKYLDNRLATLIVIVLAVTIVGRLVVLGSSQTALDAARGDLDKAATELADIEERVENLRAQGADDLQDVIAKIGRIEQQLPAAPDELTLTVVFDNLASASGVQLIEFTESSDRAVAGVDSDLVEANAFSFKISGPYSAAVDFIDRVLASPTFLATFDSLTIRASGSSGDNDGGAPSLFETTVEVTGVVLLWSLSEAPLVAAGGGPSPGTTDDAVPGTDPSDEETPTTEAG